jgi:hypothetical protein
MVKQHHQLLLASLAGLFHSASAGFGFGGCPTYYPKQAFYSEVPDGSYYLNKFDRGFWTLSSLLYQPTEITKVGRRYEDCTRTTITQASEGLSHHVTAPWKGAMVIDKTYSMSCMYTDYCEDEVNKYYFDLVYYDSTNNVFATYYCIDISSFASETLASIIQGLTGMVLNPFYFSLIFGQVNIAHVSYIDVWSTAKTFPTAANQDLKYFMLNFPYTSIGTQFTLIDLFYPVVRFIGWDYWKPWWLTDVNQADSVCYTS